MKSIKTLDHGLVPVTNQLQYVMDTIIDLVEMCNGDCYEIKKSYSGALVAVKVPYNREMRK